MDCLYHQTHQTHSRIPFRDIWNYPQIVTVPASPTLDEDEPEETLDTRAGPIDRDTGNIEQLTNPGQPSPTTVQLV